MVYLNSHFKPSKIHKGEQRESLTKLHNQTKKRKALRGPLPEKEIDSEDEAEMDQDVEMEEL